MSFMFMLRAMGEGNFILRRSNFVGILIQFVLIMMINISLIVLLEYTIFSEVDIC